MERVAFLIEDSGERLSCLLNPDSLVVKRRAGIEMRRSLGGMCTTAGVNSDDRLLHTGGGYTELVLELLFDTNLNQEMIAEVIPGVVAEEKQKDVRDLTQPLWNLAENRSELNNDVRLPIVRFVWGKAWNIPCVITAVSEKLERFTVGGVPQRSWLTMQLVRTIPETKPGPSTRGKSVSPEAINNLDPGKLDLPAGVISIHQVMGGNAEKTTGEAPPQIERLDIIAANVYGDPGLWRLIAVYNQLADPFTLTEGTVLELPPLSLLEAL